MLKKCVPVIQIATVDFELDFIFEGTYRISFSIFGFAVFHIFFSIVSLSVICISLFSFLLCSSVECIFILQPSVWFDGKIILYVEITAINLLSSSLKILVQGRKREKDEESNIMYFSFQCIRNIYCIHL